MSDRLRDAIDVMRELRESAERNGSPITYLHPPPAGMTGHPPFAVLVDVEWLEGLMTTAGYEDVAHEHREGDEDEIVLPTAVWEGELLILETDEIGDAMVGDEVPVRIVHSVARYGPVEEETAVVRIAAFDEERSAWIVEELG